MKPLLALLVAGAILAPQAASAASAAIKSSPKTSAHAKSVLPWVEDDYARAVADAKARSIPMFVESWAPW
ncbi:MAG TPA: hypothetical protein VJY35_11570 [Candidatus Eisenbacteria bacterium]|nr:hypothetical protein [Candidatus Eisenbacteria bacterium]